MKKPRRLLDFLSLAQGHLSAHGIETSRLDAEVLLAYVLGLDRIHLYVQHDRPLIRTEVDQYREMIARRAKGEPVAYIIGRKEFFSLPFYVDQRVLIPRPETEILVEKVIQNLKALFPEAHTLDVVDVGTGSGAIAAVLAKEEPRAFVTAIDIDPEALQVAEKNIRQLGVDERVRLVRGDLLEPVQGRRFHAIVSNPPYIAPAEWDTLPRDVRGFEPAGALRSGEKGLYHLRRLIQDGYGLLLDGGFLALELGASQGPAIRAMGLERGYERVEILHDLAGKDRIALLDKGEPS